MTLKPNKRLVWIAGFIVILVFVLMTAGAFILPVYVQSRIIPRLAAGFGLSADVVHVRRMGWWGADLGPIRLDAGDAPVLTLAAVQIDYTPWGLLRGRIGGITLGGVGLALTVTSDGVSITGLELPPQASSGSKAGAVPDLETLLPIQLGHFVVLQSRLDVDYKGRRHVIPVDLRLETARLGRGILHGRADLSILGNPIGIEAALDQRANSITLKFECDRFLLESLTQIGVLPAELEVSGGFDVKGRCTLQLNPLAMTGLEISGRLTEVRAATAQAGLENMTTDKGDPQPVILSVTAADARRILFACGPFQLTGPLKTAVTAFKGELASGNPGWSLDATMETLIPRQTLDIGLSWEKELPMSWRIQAAEGAENTIDFKVFSAGGQPMAIGMQAFQLANTGYRIELAGHYADGRLEADGALTTDKLQFLIPGGVVMIPSAKISSTMAMAASSVPEPSRILTRAVLSHVRSEVSGAVITLPRIEIKADGQADRSGPWAFQGHMKIADGGMQDKTLQVALQGFDLDLPLQWPPVAKVNPGRLSLRAFQWKDHQLGGARGSLQQEARSLKMNLEHRSKLFAGLIVLISGGLKAEGMHADVRIPSYQPAQDVDLGRLFSAAVGIQANGRIEALGTVDVAGGEPRGRAYLKIDHGTVTQDEHLLRLDGIAMTFQIDSIAPLKSAPRQNLRVEKLQFGELAARNLDVDFQLEDHRTLFVEKVGLQWCRGRINAAAIRIIPDKEDYDVTLFCDRLNLAMVLEQLGAAEAGGEGTVNGRIPVRWVNGRLSFDNGFLYSTPGQPGQIQLKGAEGLLSGMPPGTPQHTQLDIATEALKDYTYQWAKLSVQSEKDILLLKLQLDGKPNRMLPFAYDQQLGQFKRIAGEGQAEFKGISIDLNFKSPLNEIIHYKEFLNRN